MNKGDLINEIAKNGEMTKKEATAALESLLKGISGALKKGDRVILVGFGTFNVIKRAARTGRNPQTGKSMKIAAKKVARFKAGTELTKKIK